MLATTAVYSVLVGLMMVWFQATMKDTNERLDKATNEVSQQVEKASAGLADLERRSGRYKTLMLARLADYSKELEFWRDTVRKVLYTALGDNKAADKLIESVSSNLKTYQTRSRTDIDFSTVEALARLLADSGQGGETKK